MPLHFPISQSVFSQLNYSENNELQEFSLLTEKSDVKIICTGANEDLLAFSDTEKGVHVFDVQQNKKVATYQLPHRASVLRFVKSPESALLVGDRSGNVLRLPIDRYADAIQINVTDKNIKNYLLLGHVSMLSDLDICEEGGLLVTGDRDEKIRVSRYPNSYIIEAFCLGHESYITQVKFLSRDLLISGSGDGTLRLWRPMSGECLQVLDCVEVRRSLLGSNTCQHDENVQEPDVKPSFIPFKICVIGNIVLVAFHKCSNILILKVSGCDNQLIPEGYIQTECTDTVLDIQVTAPHYLFAVVDNAETPLKVWEIDSSTQQFHLKSNVSFKNRDSRFYEKLAADYLRIDDFLRTLTKAPVEIRGLDIYLAKKDARIQSKKARLTSQKEAEKKCVSSPVS